MSGLATSPQPSEAELWRPGWWLGFLWGFAEGTLFFIIPDVLLSWASLAGARCGFKILGAILAGSLVAGLGMYTWAASRPELSRSVVASVPFVRAKMFDKVQEDYRDQGISGMLKGPGSGIPYKVYAVLAPPISNPVTFALISIPARLERLITSWLLFTALGWLFRRWIRNHSRITTTLFAAFWIVTYALYWTRI
jgi:hypothetical protein